jgi:hypothetical protein
MGKTRLRSHPNLRILGQQEIEFNHLIIVFDVLVDCFLAGFLAFCEARMEELPNDA